MGETTAKDFKVFVDECRYWIEVYGLKGWHWNFYHNEQLSCEGGRASYAYNQAGRVVAVFLTPNWDDDEISEYNIRVAAYHEICEIMLAKISNIAQNRSYDETALEDAQHEIIRSFENVHFAERARSMGIGDGKIGEIVPAERKEVCKTKRRGSK